LTTLDLESFGRRRDWRAVRISSFAPADRRWPGHRHPRHHPAALPRNLRSHHQRHRHHHRDPQPPRLLTRPAPVRPPRRHRRAWRQSRHLRSSSA